MGAIAQHPESPLFASLSTRTLGEALLLRSIREVVHDTCRAKGLEADAGELNLRSAALDLAISEGEPYEVVVSIADRTWRERMSAK